MTIIQPHQTGKTNFLISIFTLTSIGVAVWGVFLYNQLIDLRHNIAKQEKAIKQSEVESAELKNNLYNLVSSKNLESLAQEKSLVLENKPEYVKTQFLTANY